MLNFGAIMEFITNLLLFDTNEQKACLYDE